MLRYKLRKAVSALAGLMEIVVSVIILVAVILSAAALFMDLFGFGSALFNGSSVQTAYSEIFSTAIYIVIGIEMIKMIVKHTPDSVLEVLLFVIAKRVVADTAFGSVDMLLCVLAIAVIFAIRKFLHFDVFKSKDGTVFSADTRIKDIEELMRIDLPNDIGETVGEVVSGEFQRLERRAAEGEEILFNEALFRIHSMENGRIKKIEIVTKRKK